MQNTILISIVILLFSAVFVSYTSGADSASCAECHQKECTDWQNSDHSKAMNHATDKTVRGKFSGVPFRHIGFTDIAAFDDDTVKIIVHEIFQLPPAAYYLREYKTDLTNSPPYNTRGNKFQPPIEPCFDDFALACFDAPESVKDKLLKAMNETQRKEFDEETAYRKSLVVNRPTDITGAQARIINKIRQLIEEKKIAEDKVPKRCQSFRFFKEDEKYKVETDLGVFEIKYTLGYRPLQQYLVETEKGRIQCLPVAWDTVNQRWHHLYPKEQIPKDDPLHWSKNPQNWNYMCADCHTTDFKKNFDPQKLSYSSTFSEFAVGCAACHGDCKEHSETARKHNFTKKWDVEKKIPLGIKVLSEHSAEESVGNCAFCHTRRRVLKEGKNPPEKPYLDYFVPEMQDRDIYYPDGQLLEEAFEVGSFLQSKMHSRGVSCANCHESHSLKLKYEGNRLCTQCHTPSIYDVVEHHFHPDKSKPGTQCVECHFPQSVYMVNDPRRDHSIRKPSPALTKVAAVPNSCTLCHQDRKKGETLDWADALVEKWYAKKRNENVGYNQAQLLSKHYAAAINAARNNALNAAGLLAEVINDKSNQHHRDIIRASALLLLGRLNHFDNKALDIAALLNDRCSLVRLAAVETTSRLDGGERIRLLTPLLNDDLRAIRIETVRLLADVSERLTDEKVKAAFIRAAVDFKKTCAAVNDQAAAYLNEAVFEYDIYASKRRQLENWYAAAVQELQQKPPTDNAAMNEALKIRNDYMKKLTARPLELYLQSIKVEPEFTPSRINLAMIYNERGETKEAEEQFRKVLQLEPQNGDVWYSLGLLSAETGNLKNAEEALRNAVKFRPDNPRIHYNFALLLMQLERRKEALPELEAALKIEPKNIAFLYSLAVLHIQDGNRKDAALAVDKLIQAEPNNPQWKEFKQQIR
ncbi:MAG: tetratricopeptide repeat protein [Planctomycetaceae bacterium]|nr:tetratricopeptide repeat protein [Planctomycetaceae bacterium]